MLKRNFIVIAGVVIGLVALVLAAAGNPPNMALCAACFVRDMAGSLGLHRANTVQYMRPEIIGIVLGAFVTSLATKEFRPRGGANTAVRFLLGFLVMVGALVFLGCPIRLILRLAAGDLNAFVALLGLIAGVFVGVKLLAGGYYSGRSNPEKGGIGGLLVPAAMVIFLLLLIAKPVFNPQAGGPLFFSKEGPGSLHAPLLFSLVGGLVVGVVAQRSRLCLVGGIRDLLLLRDFHLLKGFVSIFAVVFLGNLIMGKVNFAFAGQPIAHTAHLWNFLGMFLVGLASTLAGGCPLRQLILAGEGDYDAGMYVAGLFAGAAFAHNFMLAASPKGVTVYGQIAVIAGIIVAVIIALVSREVYREG
ncbi:MAG: uncharacterized protein PWQ91_1586 [Eubacteriales bacterium]|nr:uncharacterized protein [Eubacteriales bacterium]MDN5364524.1 uncharacterized protein [Eubacteriales bacterium]